MVDRTNRVFGRLSRFEEAYPDLQDAIVDYKQFMSGASSGPAKNLPNHHSIRGDGGVIPCDNPACNNGGFQIDQRIADAKAIDASPQVMNCSGHEDMGRGQRRNCGSRIRYELRLIPKQKE